MTCHPLSRGWPQDRVCWRAAGAAVLRELRSAPEPFLNVPVVVLSASRGFPPRFRAQWTALQAGLAATAPQGHHVVVEDTGHSIPTDQPGIVADAILLVVALARAT